MSASSTISCDLSVPLRSTIVHVAVCPLSRFVTVTRVPTLRNHVAHGSEAHVEPLAQRLNDAVPVCVVSDGGAGTAIVIDPDVSAVVGPPTKKLAASVVVVGGAAGGAGRAGPSAGAAATVPDGLLPSGDASASPPGA